LSGGGSKQPRGSNVALAAMKLKARHEGSKSAMKTFNISNHVIVEESGITYPTCCGK